jgi:hypothetical protein
MRFGQTKSKLEEEPTLNEGPVIGFKRNIENVAIMGTFGAIYLGCHGVNKLMNGIAKAGYSALQIPYETLPADETHLFETVVRKEGYF